MRKLIVVNDPRSWDLHVPGLEIVSSRDYLTDPSFSKQRNLRVFNLSRSYSYQSRGYYVSLLAEARGHKVIPSAKALLDMRSPAIVKVLSRELEGIIQSSLSDVKEDSFTLSVYFGRNVEARFDKLAHELTKVFQAPLLRARFVRSDKWELRSMRTIPMKEIPEEHMEDLEVFAEAYFGKKRYYGAREDTSKYDLAILVNPADKAIPSNKRAIVKFKQAAENMGFAVQVIGPDDIDRVGEFDALFLRENTHVNHHTYQFASKAKKEGIVVFDTPEAILKCNNKVYLAEALAAAGIPTPATMIVHSENRDQVAQRFGFPLVLKLPDSTFSVGVMKATSPKDLEAKLDQVLDESDLVIAQEYIPTDYDWRIGVLDGTPLYACKYFMARGHWQIYNWSSSTRHDQTGTFETVSVEAAPPHIVETAVKAVKAIGVKGLFGVDLKEHEGKACVIEVNECPNIDHGVEDKVMGDALYKAIIGAMLQRIELKIRSER